jgi:hypothetical protein
MRYGVGAFVWGPLREVDDISFDRKLVTFRANTWRASRL